MILALALGLVGTYLVSEFLAASGQERFVRQLTDGGQQAVDGVVRWESDLLEVERLVTNTEGVFEALVAQDAEAMRDRVLPLVINADVDLVAVVDGGGVSLLTVRRRPGGQAGEYETLRGEGYYGEWQMVSGMLGGASGAEKRAGLELLLLGPTGSTGVFLIGGPILGSGDRVLGVVLVGQYADTLARDLSLQAGVNISIYALSGQLLASTLEIESPESVTLESGQIEDLRASSGSQSPLRRIQVAGVGYGEVLAPLRARNGADMLGVIGASLVEAAVAAPAGPTMNPTTVVALGALILLLVVIVGLLVSNSITRPLVRMADASMAIATGDLATRLPEGGADEIGMLASTFNRMVEGLQEGLIYHDLLGRAVTPEVREELRRSLSEGARSARVQRARVSVLTVGLRGVVLDSSRADPVREMESLSEYFAALVPLIANHGGVVYRFEGETAVAVFGLFPRPLPAPVGAMQATHAGLELVELVQALNPRRRQADLPAIGCGIGIATGEVLAGGLGTQDRLQYTILGEAVEQSGQLVQVLHDSGAQGVLIDGNTHHALGGARSHFVFGRQGQAQVRGRHRSLEIREVTGRLRRLLEAGGAAFFDETTESF